MKFYLVFNIHCSVCKQLAETIENLGKGKLKAINIHDDLAKSLLNQVYPHGWKYSPYLLKVKNNKISTWTGINAALKVGSLVGPRQAWHIWKLGYQNGIFLSPTINKSSTSHSSRRDFLKLSAGVSITTTLNWFGFNSKSKISAKSLLTPCDCSITSCQFAGYTSAGDCLYKVFYCYDPCGHYCYTSISPVCCSPCT